MFNSDWYDMRSACTMRPNIALQRTPLARPLRWARSWGVVAHRRSCRSVEVASGAAESRRWAACATLNQHARIKFSATMDSTEVPGDTS